MNPAMCRCVAEGLARRTRDEQIRRFFDRSIMRKCGKDEGDPVRSSHSDRQHPSTWINRMDQCYMGPIAASVNGPGKMFELVVSSENAICDDCAINSVDQTCRKSGSLSLRFAYALFRGALHLANTLRKRQNGVTPFSVPILRSSARSNYADRGML